MIEKSKELANRGMGYGVLTIACWAVAALMWDFTDLHCVAAFFIVASVFPTMFALTNFYLAGGLINKENRNGRDE